MENTPNLPPASGASHRCRVVHLIPQDSVGGVEAAARSMAMRKDLPCDFTLQLVAGRSLLVDKALVRESRFRSVNNLLAHLSALAAILIERPDVLICSLWRSMPVGLLAKLLRRQTTLVCFLHSETPAHSLDRFLNSLGMKFCDSVWADSAATLESRNENLSVPARAISFVTERRVAPEPQVPRPSPRFVCWNRLGRVKGVDRSLQLMAQITKVRPDARFEIWGRDDGELANLQRMAVDLGIQHAVQFMGPASPDQLPSIAQRHSFYLQLSRREGMAMSAVEAMQLGLVPIATPVGELKRYCQPGRTGLLCDVNRLAEVTAEVCRLLDNPSEYHAIARGAREYWRAAPLYADDVCRAASESAPRSSAPPRANMGLGS